ncbi:MAG: hypothetical protein OXE42_02865 [Gammaproteobacteria bacterium]|nr:hypothetical protein [Gammaproteobacteria bacterium]
MTDFEHITTESTLAAYHAFCDVFAGLMSEMRELSKKKPDATLSKSKVMLLNRVLEDILSILKTEPEGKYLDLLNDEELPQNSDAVLVMVQYEKALIGFKNRYQQYYRGTHYWITEENIKAWKKKGGAPWEDSLELY